jgi:hypothetical protein
MKRNPSSKRRRKLARQLQTPYRFLPFFFICNNLGHLLFA